MSSDDPMINPIIGIGVNASLARAYVADHRLFVEQLTHILETTMPHAISVKRKGGLFTEKHISRLNIEIDGIEHILELGPGGAYLPQKARVVGGIRLKTETVSMKDWLESLTSQISAAAETHKQAQDAILQITGN